MIIKDEDGNFQEDMEDFVNFYDFLTWEELALILKPLYGDIVAFKPQEDGIQIVAEESGIGH